MTPVLAVICKEPVPGRAKTRLTPPFTPTQAASLAGALLTDTWSAVHATPGARRVAVVDGDVSAWSGDAEVVEQSGGGLDERLGHAFGEMGAPAFLVGMDTPQVTCRLLRSGLDALVSHDAVFGPASDGGFWAVGLRRPDPGVFAGVPMSTCDTGRVQLERLRAAGLSVALLPELEDVDDIGSARRVAHVVPDSAFARGLRELGHG